MNKLLALVMVLAVMCSLVACGKNNKNTETTAQTEASTESDMTPEQVNIVTAAKQYVTNMTFSREALIEQLESDNYGKELIAFAVDHCGADWNKEALSAALSDLDMYDYSRSGLLEQLKIELFTDEEIAYALDHCGADWNEQAVNCAAFHLEFETFTREDLIKQLESEGFTNEQAVYGVEKNGL